MIRIESLNNKTIKLVSSLKMKKAREKERLFFAEGERNVNDGAKKQIPEMIFISEDYKGNKDFPCDVYELTPAVFKKISDTETPQGILGVFKINTLNEEDIKEGNVLILNGVRDPGNIGTLIRTAIAADFKTLIFDKTCADVFSPKTVRAAMSGIFGIDIVYSENLLNTMDYLKKRSFVVCSADMNGEKLFDAELKGNLALILGNEANGVEKEISEKADRIITIPMSGNMESLNVAVAGSVIMYEAARQRKVF